MSREAPTGGHGLGSLGLLLARLLPPTSALCLKADVSDVAINVRYVPLADIGSGSARVYQSQFVILTVPASSLQ